MITPSISREFAQRRLQDSSALSGTAHLGALTAFISLLVLSHPAEATGRTSSSRQPAKPAATEQPGPPEPLIAIISLSNQHIEVFGPGGSITRSRVSTGQSGHDTPTGVFSVLQRNRYHRSNIYSNAPMPYMQRLTWSGIALHEGYVPNYRASHGCIRMPGAFARTLWDMGRLGMRVIVSPSPVAPTGIAHASLPEPRLSQPQQTSALVRVAAAGSDEAPPAPNRRLTPYEAAQARLVNAVAMRGVTERAVKPALEAASAAAAEANRLSEALRASAGILADAEEQLDLDKQGMATVQTEAAEAAIIQRIRMAEAGVTAARAAHEKLGQSEPAASEAAFAAAKIARDAIAASEAAEEELHLARKGVSPISVFVSRKTGYVYVRQGMHVLYEGPVTVAEPDRPLGTHVYTAMQESNGGAVVRWVSVTVPTHGGESAMPRSRSEAGGKVVSSASEALNRVTLPEEVRELLGERLWPGASLIVSDFGLGETNQFTEFVIQTR